MLVISNFVRGSSFHQGCGLWKRLDLVTLPALYLPKLSTNTSSYPTYQVKAPLSLPHPWFSSSNAIATWKLNRSLFNNVQWISKRIKLESEGGQISSCGSGRDEKTIERVRKIATQGRHFPSQRVHSFTWGSWRQCLLSLWKKQQRWTEIYISTKEDEKDEEGEEEIVTKNLAQIKGRGRRRQNGRSD